MKISIRICISLFILMVLTLSHSQPIIPDFQVNENGGLADHNSAAITCDRMGQFMVTWTDYRNARPDIFAQQYTYDGTPVGQNIKINDDPTGPSHSSSSIASGGNGHYIVVWSDERDSDESQIYAQRLDPYGSPISSNFKVNDDASPEESHYSPFVAADGSGRFVAAWEDFREGNRDIYAQRYDSDGSLTGNNFKVNDSTGTSSQKSVSMAMDWEGNLFTVWEDSRNSDSDIYGQMYGSDGSSLGSNFKINDDSGTRRQYAPAVSADSSDNFVVTWQDERDNKKNIYAQRYDSNGSALGSNFKVNDDPGDVRHLSPAVSVDIQGQFVITWYDERELGDFNVYAQRFGSDGSSMGGNLKINEDFEHPWLQAPVVAMNLRADFMIVWTDNRSLTSDIYGQMGNIDGSITGSNFRVSDDTNSAIQIAPMLTLDDNGNFIIAWIDDRNHHFDIYAQCFLSDGSAMGNNFRVNDDTTTSDQNMCDIASDSSGNFTVTWRDSRNNNYDIFAQRYDQGGSLSGDNFQVNDDVSSTTQNESKIAMDYRGNSVIIWSDKKEGDNDIYAQRYDENGSATGNSFKVNDDGGTEDQEESCIAMDRLGNFIIAWSDKRDGDWDVYGQIFSSNGNATGNNFKVNDDLTIKYQGYPDIGSDSNGNFVIVWEDYRDDILHIYGQRFMSNGAPIESNFNVNENQELLEQAEPSIGVDEDGRFVVAWEDERNNPYYNIYGRQFDIDGSPLGDDFRITSLSESRQLRPKVKVRNNRIYTTWQDNRAGNTGYDIWASVLDWSDLVSVQTQLPRQSLSYDLFPNFPNPFNPITIIPFSLAEAASVKISVFDITGRFVKEIENQTYSSGRHEILFDGSDVSSGIYILKVNFITAARQERLAFTRKISILK
ncbi:T9SS type A sorting domain-containing protein [candidate division KSB1 bacterium]|nr:T9SS type A sorting domain-containing protein [candidate division KSB1 bacterium]